MRMGDSPPMCYRNKRLPFNPDNEVCMACKWKMSCNIENKTIKIRWRTNVRFEDGTVAP